MRIKSLIFSLVYIFSCAGVNQKPKIYKPTKDAVMLELETFDGPTIKGLQKKLAELDEKGYETIYLRINSNGGSIGAALDLIQFVEQMKTPLTCVSDYRSLSAGAYTLESDACSVRLMTKRSVLLFHAALTLDTSGNAKELRHEAEALETITNALVASTAERMGMSEEDFQKQIDGRNWWLSYTDALKYNAIDGLVDPKDLPKLIAYNVPSALELLLDSLKK